MTEHTPENDIYLTMAEGQAKIDMAIYNFRRDLNKQNRNAKIKLILQLGIIWFLFAVIFVWVNNI